MVHRLHLGLFYKIISVNINGPICCPPFDPTIWDEKIFKWENKNFIKDKVLTFFTCP